MFKKILSIVVFFHLAFTYGQSGTITGKVIDDAGMPLPGASLVIEGTSIGTSTNFDGDFQFNKVNEGNYNILVSYLGFDDQKLEVQVVNNQNTVLNISMVGSSESLDEVVISSSTDGQSKALNKQRTAEQIVSIVSADQIGRFPDLNTAEAVQRIPSVSLQRDQGEGRFVQIRGTPPGLTNISINGEQIPSPEGEFRYVALDVVPIDQLAAIEIVKSVTPDMDGDAIGGSVNLITKSAGSGARKVSGTIGGGYNTLVESAENFQLQASYSERFGKFGLAFNSSYLVSTRGSDNNESVFRKEDFGNGEVYVLDQLQLRDYEIERKRLGLSGTIDYKIGATSSLFIRGIFNDYSDQEFRRRMRFRPGKGTYLTPTTVEEGEFTNSLKDREQVQQIWSINTGGKHNIGSVTLDYEFAYSEAKENELDRIDIGFEHSETADFTIDRSDVDFPQFTITNGVDRFDYSQYEFDEIELTDRIRNDRNITAKFNVKIPYKLGTGDGYIKTGFKHRDKEKDRINNVKVYGADFVNPQDEFTLNDILGDFRDDDFLGGRYDNGLFADPGLVRGLADRIRAGGFLDEDTEASIEESDGPFYEATEKVSAAYLMTKIQFGKLMVLSGLRYENTTVDYIANELDFDNPNPVTRVEGSNDYDFWLPNLQFKYDLAEYTNLRAAFTWTYARPNFDGLVPARTINQQDQEIEEGNPLLEPADAFNFDILGEHYFKNVGVLSGGFFYKNIDNFIYTSIQRRQGGAFDGFRIESPINGSVANLWGLEVNWQQNFTFLPGIWSGFGIYANYTFTDSSIDVFRGEDVDNLTEEETSLPGQADHIFNLALAYKKGRVQARIAWNYNGSYIQELSSLASDDTIFDDRLQLDFSTSFKISDTFSIYAEAINLNDSPVRQYQGDRSRPVFQEFYEPWYRFGLKFNLK